MSLRCKIGLHAWTVQPKDGCCLHGIDTPAKIHQLDGTWRKGIFHTCLVIKRRTCTRCGEIQTLELDTMGNPYTNEYYWSHDGQVTPARIEKNRHKGH